MITAESINRIGGSENSLLLGSRRTHKGDTERQNFINNMATNPTAAFAPAPANYRPDIHGPVPIGTQGYDVSNYLGNKFTRAWLSGEGGQDIDMGLGSISLPIAYMPFNSRTISDMIAATGYSSGQSLPTNLDINAPGRYFSPNEWSGETIAATKTDCGERGFITTTNQQLPILFTAKDGNIRAPTNQFNSLAQTNIGGASTMPSVSYLQPHISTQPPPQNVKRSIHKATASNSM